MKQITVTLFLLLFATVAVAQTASTPSQAQAGAKRSAQAAQITALRDAYVAAYNAKQADKVAALYTTDAVLMTPEGTYTGRDAILAEIQRQLTQGTTDLHAVSTKSGGDARNQWEAGDFSQKVKNQEAKGRYLVTLRMVGGKWLIAAHANVPILPPAGQHAH